MQKVPCWGTRHSRGSTHHSPSDAHPAACPHRHDASPTNLQRSSTAASTAAQKAAASSAPVLVAVGGIGDQVGALAVQGRRVLPAVLDLQARPVQQPGITRRRASSGSRACKGAGQRQRGPLRFRRRNAKALTTSAASVALVLALSPEKQTVRPVNGPALKSA